MRQLFCVIARSIATKQSFGQEVIEHVEKLKFHTILRSALNDNLHS
ncbi:hypothetical protein QF024_000361 [Chryseobacterium nepalense]|nr:hypothetical protein [Chryseobacterium nepalense]